VCLNHVIIIIIIILCRDFILVSVGQTNFVVTLVLSLPVSGYKLYFENARPRWSDAAPASSWLCDDDDARIVQGISHWGIS